MRPHPRFSISSLLTNFRRLALAAAAALSLFLIPTPSAHAQMGFGGMDGMTETVTSRSLDNFAAILGLSDDQKTAAEALREAYQAAVRNIAEKFQKDMRVLQDDLADTQDMADFQKQIMAKAKDMATESKALETTFFADLKSILDESQLEKWPGVERAHRRGTLLRFGMVSGAGVDLLAALKKAKIATDTSPEIAEIAARYETDMDQLLVVMERDQKSQQDRMFEGNGAFDMTKIQEMMKAMYESAAKVRDLNRDTNRKLLAVVPADKVEAYTNEFNRRSFPRVYRQSETSKLLKAASGFSDLTNDQKSEIERLSEDYRRSLGPANDKWAKAVEEQEDAAGGTMMVMMNGFSGQGGDPAVTEARKARRELDKQSKERLLAVLTEEQKARLPEPTVPKDAGFGNMFMTDDDEEDSK